MKLIKDEDIRKNLIGNWTLSGYAEDKTGISFDKYLPNDIKITEVTILQGRKRVIISAESTWSIEDSILTEEIISIDKNFTKNFGVKKGDKYSSYVVNCTEKEVTLRLKGQKKLLEATYYKQSKVS